MIAMVFFRGGLRPPTALYCSAKAERCERSVAATLDIGVGGKEETGTRWIKKWTQLLKYMRQEISDEPECHGCMGTNLAARIQEIIAAHPSTATAHQQAEKEMMNEIKQALKTMKKHK